MAVNSAAIIGLGLIGGSIAKGLRSANPELQISAFDNEEILKRASEEGVIDTRLGDINDSLSADVIFLCLPVDISLRHFTNLAKGLNPNQILTDVCGVKGVFQKEWEHVDSAGVYIGGHPMTGKEKGGYGNSDMLLFENSVYILSDKYKNEEASRNLTGLIETLGARITYLDPFLHDKIVANVSHLPQLVSVALVNEAARSESGINFLDFAAGGFRDMTRIASSDYGIWDSVLRSNKGEILISIDKMIDYLTTIRSKVDKTELGEIAELFETARVKRDEIPKSNKGFISPLIDVFVFVKDEPGVISRISTSLFERNINIKDIELLKIREGTGGTFRLSFESDKDAEQAVEILNKTGFATKQ